MSIPARYLFVWTGRRFPYFARLAIESALVAEPDATVELHTFGDAPAGAPHLEALRRHRRFAVVPVDLGRVFEGLGVDGAQLAAAYHRIGAGAPSARSNLIRYAVLFHRGGIYLDTDVLVIRAMADLRAHQAFAGQEQVLAIDAERVEAGWRPHMVAPGLAWAAAWSLRRADAALGGARLEPIAARLDRRWQHTQLNNAVIGAAPGAPFVGRLLARAVEVDPTVRYRLGPTLISEVVATSKADVTVLPPVAFYAVPPSYSFRFFTGGAGPVPAEARVLHVVSSNHGRLLGRLDEATVAARADRGSYYAVGATVARDARALAPAAVA
ncbi:MAG: glycosyltransferase [Kofleriaceae bacterium]